MARDGKQVVSLLQILEDEGRACGVHRRVSRRQAVFREGDDAASFGVVIAGRVKLVRSHSSGKETILEVVGPGELVCVGAVWKGEHHCCTAIAEDDAEVLQIPRTVLDDAMGECPASARRLLDASADRAMAMCRRVTETTCGRVDQRIAATVIHLAGRGRLLDDGRVVAGRFSRQDIADLCGTTIETAIRTMRIFEKNGWIETSDEGLVVCKLDALEELVDGA